MNKILGVALVVIIVIATAGAYLYPKAEKAEKPFRGTSSDYFEAQRFNAGASYGYSIATSTTGTTQTLKAADVAPDGVAYDVVLLTPNVGDVTLTFPASSTLPSFLPTAGMSATQCWYNASTTAGIDITFAAGAGMDFEVSSSTVSANTAVSDGSVCFKFIRKPKTSTAFDFLVMMERFVNGD